MTLVQQTQLAVPSVDRALEVQVDTVCYLDAVNPATVPQRSPFRYPGGKTWLVPFIRKWLETKRAANRGLVEPFAGGAIIGLTAAFEELASRVTLVEIDPDVAAVWRTILYGDGRQFADRYASFKPDHESVEAVLRSGAKSLDERAFITLLRNRISRGGVIAPGAGILKKGENGRGLSSRWYPATIRKRILDIIDIRERIQFIEADGMSVMEALARKSDLVWFIDPPYTVAGRRLYTYSQVDHERLFRLAEGLAGEFILTYDESDEVMALANRSRFEVRRIRMKTTHHNQKHEFIIGRSLTWLDSQCSSEIVRPASKVV